MIKSASEIRSAARAALSGRWADGALLAFIYLLISWFFSRICFRHLDAIWLGASSLVSSLLLPLGWGFCIIFLLNRRGVEDSFNIGHLFDGYKDFKRIFPALFVKELYVILWALLGAIVYFVILWFVLRYGMACISSPNPSCVWEGDGGYPPGEDLIEWVIILIPALIPAFVKSLSYSMTPFILYDKKEMGTKAIDLSMKMMKGHKTDYFLFCCRFIGWILICVLTFGLASFVVNPYFERAKWHYYRALVNGANDATSNPQPPVFLEK